MQVFFWSSKRRRMCSAWALPALTLIALAAAPAAAADRAVIAEEFTSNN
jgi:hypothetical protein